MDALRVYATRGLVERISSEGRVLMMSVNSLRFSENVAHVHEEFVDGFRVDVEGLIEAAGDAGNTVEDSRSFLMEAWRSSRFSPSMASNFFKVSLAWSEVF